MQNDMRDRLVCLLTDDLPHCTNPMQITYDEIVERLADHLIANGVIAPPCKVGDTVYIVYPDDCGADCLAYCGNCENARWKILERKFAAGMSDLLGKTVFLTREAAEEKLREKAK